VRSVRGDLEFGLTKKAATAAAPDGLKPGADRRMSPRAAARWSGSSSSRPSARMPLHPERAPPRTILQRLAPF